MPRIGLWAVGLSVLLFHTGTLRAQACCIGAAAITPGRLALHEWFLAGEQLRVEPILGSYDAHGAFRHLAAGSSEWDFEQDTFATVRVLGRAQLGMLVPLIESRRASASTGSEFGGGFGDTTLSARYDLARADEYAYFPGFALLAGGTLPTGRAPESARLPLGSDATGLGAAQLSAGLALERALGAWLVSVMGLASKRTARSVAGIDSQLAPQLSALGGIGYSLSSDLSLALIASYTAEGNATVDGLTVAESDRRLLQISAAGAWFFGESWRAQASVLLDPPLDDVGRNQPSGLGFTLALIGSLSDPTLGCPPPH